MADSDEEVAFASADEGEAEKKKDNAEKVPPRGSQREQAFSKPGLNKKAVSSGDQKKTEKPDKGKARKPNKGKSETQISDATTHVKVDKTTGAKGDSAEVGKCQEPGTNDAKSQFFMELGAAEKRNSSLAARSETEKVNKIDLEGNTESKEDSNKLGNDLSEGQKDLTSDQGTVVAAGVCEASSTVAGTLSGKSENSAGTSPQKPSLSPSRTEKRSTEEVLRRLTEDDDSDKSSGWGWGNWGSSLLNVASSSVSTFTSHVGEGFHTILETVETTLGAPDPEELVRAEMAKEPEANGHGCQDEEHVRQSTDEAEKEKLTEEMKTSEKEETSKKDDNVTHQEAAKPELPEEGITASTNKWYSSWGMSSLTDKLQQTGKKLVSGGSSLVSSTLDAAESLATGSLDVLETIGKKTYGVLADHSPGLKERGAFLSKRGEKPNLSAALREARDEAERRAEEDKAFEESRKAHFGALFDEYQGLAHLEALEILSNQSEKKVHALLGTMSEEVVDTIKPELLALKEIFELQEEEEGAVEEEHDFARLITEHLTELHLGTSPDKLNTVQEKNRKWITTFYADEEAGKKTEPKEIHRAAIQALAELTARAVEQFHKAGELILLQHDSDTSVQIRAKSLCSLTRVLCSEIEICSTKFANCLNKTMEDQENSDDINPLVTNTYLEASNSNVYIQDAFQLLLPILQQASIQRSAL